MEKKAASIIGIILAVAGVGVGIYFLVKKIKEKKALAAECEENYVSCSCLDEDFVSETVAE